jgi:hypothetical protein
MSILNMLESYASDAWCSMSLGRQMKATHCDAGCVGLTMNEENLSPHAGSAAQVKI